MTIVAKVKPSVARAMKQHRTGWRNWAKGESDAVKSHTDIYCESHRNWQREPLDQALADRVVENFRCLVKTHGHYRNWDSDGNYVGPNAA